MTLFIFLSAYIAVILLLLAAGPLWAWVALLRKQLGRRREERANLTIIKF
jgi:hypothetical protein